MHNIPHELLLHIIRTLTLVRNLSHFWCEQEVTMSTAEFLVFYCPKEPWSPAESYFTAVSIWPSADKKDCILELLICLVIALGISYCLFIPRVFNVTVCSDLVRRCENSSEGILLAQWEATEQRPPLNAENPVPGAMAWQFQHCSRSAAGWQDRRWNFTECAASYS